MSGPRGNERSDDLENDLEALGLRLDRREDEDDAPEVFGVWPENWDALLLFLACDTQWRVAIGMGGSQVLGLDYAGVEVVMRRMVKRADRARVFDQLQKMERAALPAMNRRRGG